ncbi:GNAT family N-acetyltransferase [Herbiconiux liangxiaofengii]|uniref:GNAT family N-acetyltransferase n=1 Tax=Herbiconiux liangxiaofengii TaxID=3342795 RepID=UPI0035B94B1A
MAAELRPLSESALPGFLARANAEYRRERIEAGDTPEYADERVAASNEQYFPGGQPAQGQLVFEVVDGDEVVGVLWVGVIDAARPREWWVFDIEIDEGYRRRGYGRAAMLLAEEAARSHGAVKLGLNVFGHNTVAQGLYASLDYDITAITMAKPL